MCYKAFLEKLQIPEKRKTIIDKVQIRLINERIYQTLKETFVLANKINKISNTPTAHSTKGT